MITDGESLTLSRIGSFEQFVSNYSVIPLRNDGISEIPACVLHVLINKFV